MRAAFTFKEAMSLSTVILCIQMLNKVHFFGGGGGSKLGQKMYGLIKASVADAIKLESIANYLLGVVLFLFPAAH